MQRKSKYTEAIANYDRARDGTIKEYCEKHGISYQGFRKASYQQRLKAGIQPRKSTNYKPYYEKLMKTGEPIKEFCKKNGLDYENFRVSWYKYRKSQNMETPRGRKLEKLEDIFTDEIGFYTWIDEEEE